MKGKLGSFTIIVLVLAIMGLFAMNIYQGYKYERLQAEVNEYQNTQEKWFEKNKQELTSLSAYTFTDSAEPAMTAAIRHDSSFVFSFIQMLPFSVVSFDPKTLF